MLSDESSSDSETGRFKCRSKNEDEQKKNTSKKEDNTRPSERHRSSINERYRRDFDKKRNEREHYDRHVRERHRHSRYSPVSRRRNSRDRSQDRRSYERHRYRDSRGRSKPRDLRSSSRDKHRNTGVQFKKSPDHLRDFKEEIRRNIAKDERKDKHSDHLERKKRADSREKVSLSPDQRGKKSEVYQPPPMLSTKNKSDSPIIVEHSDESEDVQPGSYYSMIPAIVKEKYEESSEIDSSDDEKLRAKLLNLENELQKTRKKKHKKKHKRKSSKCSKDKEQEPTTSVEVSSTTDIQDAIQNHNNSHPETAEVSSTQKSSQKESCEEGEISSDEETDNNFEIDPNDLRHKLKRSVRKSVLGSEKSASGVCGPALPPHLKNQFDPSIEIEGPALPPHLKKGSRNIGPSIPDNMRKVLAETDCEIIKDEISDEDVGIGPLPVGSEEKWSDAHKRLEERALDIKIKHLDGHSLQSNKVKSREQWMLELPEAKAKYLGLEARSFRSKEGPDMSDRSSWTDTPEEKARKIYGLAKEEDADIKLQQEAKARQIANRDEEHETAVRKHKKKHKREESLLEIHQKKLKKKKKKDDKDEGKKDRRPFSRDIDLQVNRFDEAQKKSIIKKAQDLNNRFSRGEAKYL